MDGCNLVVFKLGVVFIYDCNFVMEEVFEEVGYCVVYVGDLFKVFDDGIIMFDEVKNIIIMLFFIELFCVCGGLYCMICFIEWI